MFFAEFEQLELQGSAFLSFNMGFSQGSAVVSILPFPSLPLSSVSVSVCLFPPLSVFLSFWEQKLTSQPYLASRSQASDFISLSFKSCRSDGMILRSHEAAARIKCSDREKGPNPAPELPAQAQVFMCPGAAFIPSARAGEEMSVPSSLVSRGDFLQEKQQARESCGGHVFLLVLLCNTGPRDSTYTILIYMTSYRNFMG